MKNGLYLNSSVGRLQPNVKKNIIFKHEDGNPTLTIEATDDNKLLLNDKRVESMQDIEKSLALIVKAMCGIF
ncbi:hypothetical protein BK767_24945 [Bacillus thuringiensis serovar kyushuensis]|uniref:Uncharacterized protein n=2 Tax=Bacillus thuringiensis TaxID=1428 RepID=A0A9X6LID3_BACUH|nr:hypothetical protein [Bacillus thuringiensis]MEC2866847.1 hypothetical protein [Bacillus cereus]OTZ64373.1 hypothetical protein BK767_24945 [Bacillus thuringiensis serovar kyushuensis]OTZ79717.1 hypothetical protein BK768_06500 [Bacillus thuringiensis serovar tohokuensis]OUB41434.1 hypothetical protein BK716_29530 [Bacillus thuringiensis serovar higo]OUB61230.1 hypothetical protein BK716_01620 [Bacillus thuringiensis serovar higo]